MESLVPLEVKNQYTEYVEPVLPTNGSIDKFFDDLDSQLEQYADAAREVKILVSNLLSDDSICELAGIYHPDFDDNDRPNRRREKTIKNDVARLTKLVITDAKLTAQIYTDPNTDPESRQNIINSRNTPAASSQPESSEGVFSNVWDDIFDAEVTRSNTEHELRLSVSAYLEQDKTNVAEFIEVIPNLDPEEYRPLLAILHKDADDPFVEGIVGNNIRRLQDSPEVFQNEFLAELAEQTVNPPENDQEQLFTEETLSWLSWLNSHPDISSSPIELLHSQQISAWPESLQEALGNFADGKLADAWNHYINHIKLYENRSIYAVSPESLRAMQLHITDNQNNKATNKKRNNKRTRITKKANYDKYIEPEAAEKPQFAFDSISIGRKVNRGWQANGQELPIEGDSLNTEAVLSLPLVQDYLDKYAGDADIKDDLLLMMYSILREPYHNGASKMTQQKISFQYQPQSKQLPVWHLNPNKRAGLSIGNVGRNTRIYYAIHPGKRQLILLDIAHKSDADKLSSSEFRRTS